MNNYCKYTVLTKLCFGGTYEKLNTNLPHSHGNNCKDTQPQLPSCIYENRFTNYVCRYELCSILCMVNSCIMKDLPSYKTELLKPLFNKSIYNFYSVKLFTSTCDITAPFLKRMPQWLLVTLKRPLNIQYSTVFLSFCDPKF